MSEPAFPHDRIRNVAVIAHVDHGKTSLLDGLLREARVFRDNQAVATCVMDQHDLERERGITIFSKACSIDWKGYRLNVIDTPGHADFGGEVERVLRMVDACFVLVCAHDGPMPQTRYVLRKALEHGLKPILVINKADRRDARPTEVPGELLELLIDLGASDELLESPMFFASARDGKAAPTFAAYQDSTNLAPLLDALVEQVSPPVCDPEGPLQLGIAQIDWDDYVGRVGLGRVSRGALRVGDRLTLVQDARKVPVEVKKLFRYLGLARTEVTVSGAGDIALVSGPEEMEIGDTICAPQALDPLPRVKVDPPTVAMRFLATDSPFRGRDGDKVTTRQLKDRLLREARANVALKVDMTESPDQYEVKGRGILHLGILVEEMRREGYEFAVGNPRVIERVGPEGERLEPIEDVIIDVPEKVAGKVIEVLGARRGELVRMTSRGETTRVELIVPSRGLIGVRATLLNVTQGEAVIHHQLREYGPWRGLIPERGSGVLVNMETGRVTSYAVEAIEARGQLFVEPGDEVYVGQIVGENRRPEDIEVNATRKRHVTNIRNANAERKVVLAAARKFGVEDALAYIADDELVEVTPRFIRLRKRVLDGKVRRRTARAES